MAVLSVSDLQKSYGKVRALNRVGFAVPPGSVFGILGPNGSGKTTLLGIVLGILQACGGSFEWAVPGRQIGALLESPNLYPYLSGAENLKITAAIRCRGGADIPEVLKQVGLSDAGSKPTQKYSLGMKQRLAIGATLLGDPQVLVLDEPTNGLDPTGIAEVRQLIRDLSKSGRTVILASHLLDEVEKVATHVAVLKQGERLAVGPIEEVLRDEACVELGSPDLEALEKVLSSFAGIRVERADGCLRVFAPELDAGALNRHCFEHGQALSHLVSRKKTLEARFLEMTA